MTTHTPLGKVAARPALTASLLAAWLAFTSHCGSRDAVSGTTTTPPPPPPAVPVTTPVTTPVATPVTTANNGTPVLPGANSFDAPEISRTVGARGGVLVLWPRVAPRSEDPAIRALAATLQQRLRQLAERAVPGRTIDVRPEPERVCPRQGCEAMTVGASLFHTPAGGCTIVAIVSGAGASPQRLVPWVGDVTLRQQIVPFREPPESQITARDMERCTNAVGALAAHENDVVEAMRAAAPPN
jgi:hypothetical protein